MRRTTLLLLLLGFLMPLRPARLTAQQISKGDGAQLRSLATRPTPRERDRATVRDFLRNPGVREAADAHGIDVDKLQSDVATLDSTDAADLAHRIRAAEHPSTQAGGDTFVITSTTVIIVLLVLILIAVS